MIFTTNERSVLILSAASGAGHVRAADALVSAFGHIGVTAEHVEALKYTTPLFRKVYSDVYIDMVNTLDDQNSEYGIPAGMYARLKWNTIHLQDVSNITAGYQYFRFLEPSYGKRGLARDPRTAWPAGK